MKKYSVNIAEVSWRESNTPFSERFQDVYYPPEDPCGSSKHVFLDGNQIVDRWNSSPNNNFVIGELGFGTGLNFLLSLYEWTKNRKEHRGRLDQELFYISCEQFPLSKADLKKALSAFPHLKDLTKTLLKQYPPPLKGHHRLYFPDQNATLDLIFDEALQAFSDHSFIADAWHLDGFAPNSNKKLWSEELFQEIVRHSKRGTTFATFSSAGWVRRNLEGVGFTVSKFSGHGKKRESLRGVLEKQNVLVAPKQINKVTVIGAGLGGVAISHELGKRGVEVTLIDENSDHTLGASGNTQGVILPFITRIPTTLSDFYLTSYLANLNYIEAHGFSTKAELHREGAIHFLSTERLENLAERLEQLEVPKEIASTLSANEVSKEIGFKVQSGAFFYPLATSISPRKLAGALLDRVKGSVTPHYQTKALSIHKTSHGKIQVIVEGKLRSIECDAVVFANAHCLKEFDPYQWVPTEPVRGQVSRIKEHEISSNLKRILCYNGYILPAQNGSHFLGATYEHNTTDSSIRENEAEELINRLTEWVPELQFEKNAILNSRVGFRTSTRDRFPLVGNLDASNRIYSMVGFGSRGLTSILPSANLLASEILGLPLPLSKTVQNSLCPKRFEKLKS